MAEHAGRAGRRRGRRWLETPRARCSARRARRRLSSRSCLTRMQASAAISASAAARLTAALRGELRPRQLRQCRDLRQVSDRDPPRPGDGVGRAVGALGLCRRAEDERRAVPRHLAIGPQPRPPAARRGGARRRRADRGNRQRHGLAARGNLRGRRCRSMPAGAKRRGDQVLHRVARRGPAARRALGGGPTAARRARRGSRTISSGAAARNWQAALPLLAEAQNLYVVGRGIGLGARAGGGAEAQGDLRHSCRGAVAPPSCCMARWRSPGRISRCSSSASTTRPAGRRRSRSPSFRRAACR